MVLLNYKVLFFNQLIKNNLNVIFSNFNNNVNFRKNPK